MPETRIPPTDDTLEQYLAGKSEVSRVYREIPMETTSAELDDRIMRAARKELRPASTRWMLPLSAAAVVVFAVSIVFNLQHEDISKMLPQQRPELAPQSAPLTEDSLRQDSRSKEVQAVVPASTAEEQSALKSAPPGVITTDQSAPVPNAAIRAVPETGVAPSAPIPAGEEDVGQPSAYGSVAPSQMEEGDSERRESAPAAAMQRSASPKAADSAASTNNTVPGDAPSPIKSEAAGALPAGSADKSERDEKSAEAWIEHIRNLRIAGRDKEAQAEFEAFHDRYPDYALPPDLEPGN